MWCAFHYNGGTVVLRLSYKRNYNRVCPASNIYVRIFCICLHFPGHGSDNVTIVSTELSLNNALKMTTPETNEELLSK